MVLETASNRNEMVKSSAPLAIGFAVFCAHAVRPGEGELQEGACSLHATLRLVGGRASVSWLAARACVRPYVSLKV